jgi:hypothetical protein
MFRLEEITQEEITLILDEKRNAILEIPAEITGFKEQIPNADFSQPKEIPPTPMILTTEGIVQMIVYGGSDLNGRYMRLVVSVYALGGKIFYTELNSKSYKAEIVWSTMPL